MIHGGKILVSKKSGSNWLTAVAAAKSCDISVDCDTIPTSSPTSGVWRTAIAGRKSWSVSVSALLTNVEQVLDIGASVELKIYNDGVNGDYVTGRAIIKTCQCTATWGNLAQYAVTFEGNGELS